MALQAKSLRNTKKCFFVDGVVLRGKKTMLRILRSRAHHQLVLPGPWTTLAAQPPGEKRGEARCSQRRLVFQVRPRTLYLGGDWGQGAGAGIHEKGRAGRAGTGAGGASRNPAPSSACLGMPRRTPNVISETFLPRRFGKAKIRVGSQSPVQKGS